MAESNKLLIASLHTGFAVCPWFHLVEKSKCSFEPLTEWVFSATEQAEKTLVSSVIGEMPACEEKRKK